MRCKVMSEFGGDEAATAATTMVKNIAYTTGGEVRERRRRGGDDHLAVAVLPLSGGRQRGQVWWYRFDRVPSAAPRIDVSRGGESDLSRILWRYGRLRGSFVRQTALCSKSAQRGLEDM